MKKDCVVVDRKVSLSSFVGRDQGFKTVACDGRKRSLRMVLKSKFSDWFGGL